MALDSFKLYRIDNSKKSIDYYVKCMGAGGNWNAKDSQGFCIYQISSLLWDSLVPSFRLTR